MSLPKAQGFLGELPREQGTGEAASFPHKVRALRAGTAAHGGGLQDTQGEVPSGRPWIAGRSA